MSSPITKFDVFLYFADQLSRARRLELEAACKTNAQVRQWFADLTPTDAELEQQPVPAVQIDSPANRDLAASTYLSVERDERAEQVLQWSAWIRTLMTGGKSASGPPCEIVPLELLEGRSTLLYREPAPLAMAADQDTFSVPPPEVPRIYPDYAGGRLIIRQALERVPGGLVEVIVVRRRGENEVEALPPVRIQLERAEPPEGEAYWYADVPLKSLIGDFRPGDDFIYCVEAALGA
jgi:hypothetical protein